MKEGGGWDMDAAAILRGTKKPEAARRLMDFASSRRANELYASFVSQVAMEGVTGNIPDYPVGVAASMIKNDFAWASEESHAHPGGVDESATKAKPPEVVRQASCPGRSWIPSVEQARDVLVVARPDQRHEQREQRRGARIGQEPGRDRGDRDAQESRE